MKIIQAQASDFPRISLFYRDVIDHTEHMAQYGHWIYGLHPNDEMIRKYILEGNMYVFEEEGSLMAAAALTPNQGEDYHDTEWAVSLGDEEVAVVHLLCVEPRRQKQGIARKLMEEFLQLAKSHGKRAVRLDALTCNLPAQHLYEAIGFNRRGQQRWYTENLGWTDFFLYEYVL